MLKMLESEQMFNDVTHQDIPIVVKFSTNWCPDCKRMDAFLPSVLEKFDGIPIYEMDKDAFPAIAKENEVMGIPSLLVFQNGEKIGHLHSANAKTAEQVTEFLEKIFSK